MKLAHNGLCIVFTISCALSVYASDITFNYWNVGVALSDKDSEYLTNDLNFFGDVNFSKSLYEISVDDNEVGFHFWVDVSNSRNLSNSSAYKLTLFQSGAGLGLHYSTEWISTYFRLGKGESSARFKPTLDSSFVPILPAGGNDLFAPPISIFDRSGPQTSHTNREDGDVGEIGIRYRFLEKYEIGAAVLRTTIDSLSTELSVHMQRDFENLLGIRWLRRANMALRFDATFSKSTKSIGMSLVQWY